MGARFPVARDVFERIVKTFLAALGAALVSDAANWQDVLKADNWKGWAAAAVAAVFSLVMNLITTQIGKVNGRSVGASADPQVKLQPVDTSPSRL
jgi:hypothetical protein